MKSPVGLRENKLRNGSAVLHALTSRFFCRVSVIFDVQMRLILGSSGTKYAFIPLQRSSTTILEGKSVKLSILTPEIGFRKACTECPYTLYMQAYIVTLFQQEYYGPGCFPLLTSPRTASTGAWLLPLPNLNDFFNCFPKVLNSK